jgi:hypothetical protein
MNDPLLLLVLPLIGFLVLAALFGLVLRRAGRVIADTREWDSFRRGVLDVALTSDEALGGIATVIDGVRRQRLTPEALDDGIDPTLEILAAKMDAARSLQPPPNLAHVRAGLIDELERAARALEMVEHGRTILASVRRGPRELEAQTSIKRGHLNLLHAREAIEAHAASVPALPSTGLTRRFFTHRDRDERPSNHTI